MAIRWKCPNCGKGANGPARPAKNATVRFCLPCSATGGTLVERVAPKLAAKREKSTERQKSKRQRERAKEAERFIAGGVDVRKSFARAQRLACWKRWGISEYMRGLDFNLTRRGDGETSGRAWAGRKRVHVSAGEDPFDVELAIVHELTHKAHFRRGMHRVAGRKRAAIHDAEFHDMLRVAAVEFFGFDGEAVSAAYREAGGARRAYSMDAALRAVRRKVDPEGYDRARAAISAKQRERRAKTGQVEIRERDGFFEVDIPGALVGAMGLDAYRMDDGECECIASRKVGRGSVDTYRATLAGLGTIAHAADFAWDSPQRSRAERFGETIAAFVRARKG